MPGVSDFRYTCLMLVPTLPSSRFLILDDADLASSVSVSIAVDRVLDSGGMPVLVPSWWRSGADDAMPLVHKAVDRHASVYGAGVFQAELVVEPDERQGPSGGLLSQLLLAAIPLALEAGCNSVLFPVRPDGVGDGAGLDVAAVAREVDRAALVTRLAALDHAEPCEIVTPMVDLTDRQVLDLAYDMGVSTEMCWWSGVSDDAAADAARGRWSGPRGLVAAAASSDSVMKTG